MQPYELSKDAEEDLREVARYTRKKWGKEQLAEYRQMHNPAHPGGVLKYDIIQALDLSISKTADHLGISRKHLSNVCNGHNAITADLAIRLEKAFGSPTAETWLTMQSKYDLWKAAHSGNAKDVQPIQAA
jgi:antitoxin HigA-1